METKHWMKARLVSAGIRVLAATWRFHITGNAPEGASILAFWHGEMLPVWKHFSLRTNAAALVSQSSDGALLARLLEDWGYAVVRGSSSQGGGEALKTLQNLASERLALITPDGPRGPRCVFKAGAVVAATRAAVPLVLCRARFAGWRFERSWDKFHVPFPFTRIALTFFEPICVPPHATRSDIDGIIKQCEQLMNTGL